MRGTVSTACLTLQAMVRDVWASGSTIAAICQATGVTKDQLILDRFGVAVVRL